MKTRFKHLSKSTISIILAVMMVVSTFTVGIVATSAARVQSEKVGNATCFIEGETIYIDTSDCSWYDQDCTLKGSWYWDSGDFCESLVITTVDSYNHIYSVTVPNAYCGYMDLYREYSGGSGNNAGKLSEKGSNNCYKIDSSGGAYWSTYTPPTPQTVNYGVHSSGNGTLSISQPTSTGASGGTIYSGTSVTFTAAPNSGYAVEGWYSDSACTTAISGASGTTYTTTISGTTNVYVKFAEATWPPFDYSSSDDNKLRYAHSTDANDIRNALSGNVTATTEGKAFPTGKTDADGKFYLLNNQMANFDSKVPANSYVKIVQKQALGEADTGAANTDREGLLVYGSVPNNNVGNYFLTSYSIYDEKAKKYIAGSENSPVELPLKYGDNDDYYAADTDNNLGSANTGAFYFSNYSGSTDDLNSAMKVDFYNDIAVGDIRIEKQLAENATSNSFFIFDIEFRDIFGDDTDSDWNKYDGLEYWVYNENGDLVYPSAQYYTARTGIQLRAGEYALIKGIPVESRYRISERSTVGFSFDKYDLKTYMNDGNTEVDVDYKGTHYKFSDSSTNSATTDSDTILYTETEDGHAYNYYKTMIPTVSQSQHTPDDRTNYGATARIVYTNAKENISIVFKYYDRDVTNNKPASIKESPTEYSYKFDNLEKYTYYKAINDSKIADVMADKNQTTYTPAQVTAYNNIEVGGFVCIDFEAILQDNAIIFEGDVQLQNMIDNYYIKKAILTSICVILLGSFSFLNTSALVIFEGDFGFEVNSRTQKATVVEFTGNDTVVSVPGSYSGYPVTKVAASAFSGNSNITIMNLPTSIKTIESGSFESCKALREIYFPSTIENLGSNVCLNCNSLETVELSAKITSIPQFAFAGCVSLTSISVNETISSIGKNAFQYCSSLENVNLPKNVNTISEYAFDHSGICELTIPDSV